MLLRTVLPLLIPAGFLLVGCAKKKEAPPPPPFTGTLTIERIMASNDLVKLMEPWPSALAKLEGQLGKPMKIDEAKGKYQWAAMEGDSCAYVEVRSGDGKPYGKSGIVVDMTQEPMKVEKDGPLMNRADCLEIAGKSDLPPEDPNAAGPPDDGVVMPADFEKLAVAGKSKWEGKKIKVTGKVTGTGGLLLNVDGASCILETDADSAMIGKVVTAEGTVKIKQMISGGGKRSEGAELADCVVTEADGAAPAGSGSASGSGSSTGSNAK
jgi:hypothetical protein